MSKRVVTHRMIEAFRAAMLNGSISAGADALGIPQPSMSRSIADLQKAVGLPLFQKSGRTIKPTDEAVALMSKVQQSFIGLEEIAGFTEQLRKQRTGRFSICTVPSIGHSVMPEIIDHLGGKFPDVMVTVAVASYLEVAHLVRSRQADIGLTADALSIGGLETVAEFPSGCMCIGTRESLPQGATHMDVKDLAGKPFITPTGAFGRSLEALFSAHGVVVNSMVEASLFHTISELVLRGMGISIVDSLTAAAHVRRGGVAIPLRPRLTYTVYATAMSDTKLGQPAREMLRCLADALDGVRTHNAPE
jgi:DNA-binding transcriptional LysR family regulator